MQISLILRAIPRVLALVFISSILALGQACSSGGGGGDSSGSDGGNSGGSDGGGSGSGGGSGGDGDGNVDSSPVTVLGKVSFERVPYSSDGRGLDYDNITEQPAKRVIVELVGDDDAVLRTTTTDDNGIYRFTNVAGNLAVSVQAVARMASPSTAASLYDISVRDNTENGALWVIRGDENTARDKVERNLVASSGWDSASERYDNDTRVAGPFAILDTTHRALERMGYFTRDASGQDRGFRSPLNYYWSPNNTSTPARFDVRNGFIGSTFYETVLDPNNANNIIFIPNSSSIYVLGADGSDTDEYDSSVIAHEFAHYVEDTLARSDSYGGPHSLEDTLDMRLAYSEGFGNAFATVVTSDELGDAYIDTAGPGQSLSRNAFDLNDRPAVGIEQGWYNELNVTRFLGTYMAQGSNFEKFIAMMDSDTYRRTPALLSIHTAGALLKDLYPNDVSLVDSIAADNSITINDIWGTGETNDGGITSALPLYNDVTVGQQKTGLCTTGTDSAGTVNDRLFNKLGNRVFFRFFANEDSDYEIRVEGQPQGNTDFISDPDLFFFQNGFLGSSQATFETDQRRIEEVSSESFPNNGDVVIDISEFNNLAEDRNAGDYCYTVDVNVN